MEGQAIKAMNVAMSDKCRAKEKYESLWSECENRAIKRIKEGQNNVY